MRPGAAGGGTIDDMTRYAPRQRCFVIQLTTRGRITIPKSVRDALGWQSGDEIGVRIESGVAVLSKRGAAAADDLESPWRIWPACGRVCGPEA